MKYETEIVVEGLDKKWDGLRDKFPKYIVEETVVYRYRGEEYERAEDVIEALVSDGVVEIKRGTEQVKSSWYLNVNGVNVERLRGKLIITTYTGSEDEHREKVNKVLGELAKVLPEINDVKCMVYKTVTEECRV